MNLHANAEENRQPANICSGKKNNIVCWSSRWSLAYLAVKGKNPRMHFNLYQVDFFRPALNFYVHLSNI